MSTTWVRVAYGIVLGVVLAVTAGFGVLVFESGPKPPQPLGVSFSQLSANSTQAESTRIQKQIDGFFSDNQTYRDKYPTHQRNIFLWFAGLGLLLAAIGVALPAIVNYLRLGFVVSGLVLIVAGTWFALRSVPQVAPSSAASLLSLLPSGEPNGLDTAGRFLRFAVALVGTLVLLFIGLWRLTEWPVAATVFRRDAADSAVPVTVTPAAVVQPVVATPEDAPASVAPVEQLKWARPEERVAGAADAIPADDAATVRVPPLSDDGPAAGDPAVSAASEPPTAEQPAATRPESS